MTLEVLKSIIVPPATPIENDGTGGWNKVEESLDITLPSDYKAYITTFGTGKINNFLLPFNPFTQNEYLNLFQQVEDSIQTLREIKEKLEDEALPYSLYPEKNGLLPWGATDNGDTLFWLTSDVSDKWSIVVNEFLSPTFEEYDETMTGFLAKLLTGDITSEILPVDFIKEHASFTPLDYSPD